ncbi:MAG: protein-export rane protein, partial [Sediminibacterium sp.]|nr:protein-export rane protein [Sediminibacterium sp.]
MIILFLILIVIAAVALGFIVLVQNPKGGGLSGNVGGFSNQLMGVKQTTDVLEKGTWLFASIIALLALFSTLFLKGGSTTDSNNLLPKINTNTTAPAPAPAAAPAGTVVAKPGDTSAKKK